MSEEAKSTKETKSTEEKKSTSRKLTMEDIIDSNNSNNSNKKNNKNYNSNDIPKNQKVFGHNKRIKPWRTGTKSQQQIVPKGFKKGFRG